MYRIILFSLFTAFITFSCKRSTTVTVSETTDTSAIKQDTEVILVPSLTKAWETDTMFKTPESVLYDPATNVLYVSNIGGVPPNKKDGDGFISQVGLDGKVINLKWAKGFDAPKGMAIVGNTLYVTDIDRIKAVDTKTGKTTNTWKVAGSSFLNDVAATPDSIVYFTDSDKRTIHMLQNGKVTSMYADTTIGGINGIYVDGNTFMLSGYESGNVYTMNIGDKSVHQVASEIPNGDGIERYRNGWLVSNWGGEVYYIDDKGRVTEVLDTQDAKLNSADIEVIEEKDLIIIPTFFGNRVTAYTLKIGV
ncbi:MAG: hypothetical protein H7Y42_08040 [Chitinophagaceae bacterium]|nr:hypothetical protein [Chitinophagaceae bacterium]